jgi:hypothetical protein
MTDYGDIAREIAMRHVGQARFEEICRRFGLTREDSELLDRLWLEVKPDDSLEDMVALCEKHKDHPHIGPVLQAWELIAREAARISTRSRLGTMDDWG